MTGSEFEAKQLKARRQTIFLKDGSILAPKSETKRSICNVQLILAREISNTKLSRTEKNKLLLIIDEAYNLGKRMANKLDFYRAEEDRI